MGKLKNHLDEVVNKTWNNAGKCKNFDDEIMNAVLGLVGEAGEVADIQKKMWFHRDKAGYQDELLLELGDVIYYWLKLLDLYGYTITQVLEANRNKLFKRYEVKE